MTPKAAYHVETARDFMAKAHTYLAEGDLLQASEKGWGATARMVKAVAEERGWDNRTHGDLFSVVSRVAEETGDQRIRVLFSATNALHQNFYEGDMNEITVADNLKNVEEVTALLAAVLDRTAP